MIEEKIKELLNSLFSLKYKWKGDMGNYTSEVISKEHRNDVENIIRSLESISYLEFSFLRGNIYENTELLTI